MPAAVVMAEVELPDPDTGELNENVVRRAVSRVRLENCTSRRPPAMLVRLVDVMSPLNTGYGVEYTAVCGLRSPS